MEQSYSKRSNSDEGSKTGTGREKNQLKVIHFLFPESFVDAERAIDELSIDKGLMDALMV